MTTKSTARAPRKTKMSQTIENGGMGTPIKRGFFAELASEHGRIYGIEGLTTKRYLLGLVVCCATGYALCITVLGPVLNAFIIGAMLLDFPLFIILMGYLLILLTATYYGSKVCNYAANLVLTKKIDAMYSIARNKVSGLFNFRKEVTS